MLIIDEAFQGLPISVPVIDAHSHILEYNNAGWYQSFSSNADIIALMDHLGIDCIVTTPHSLILDDMEYTNKTSEEASEEYAGRIYGYIAILPHEGVSAVKKTLEKYSKNRNFVGLKFLPGYYHGPLTSEEYSYALDFADEMRCPVLCHIWNNSPPMKEAELAVKKRTGLKLLMAHQAGGYAEFSDEYSKLVKEYPNLYMEISGSLYNQHSMEEFIELVGEDRLIYGSDLINVDPRFDFGRVVFSTLDDRIKRRF